MDDVQRKADTIRHILVDVQITLDSVSEQKAMVDHVFAELSRLEYVLQEAHGTMRALQAERDVAQRIVGTCGRFMPAHRATSARLRRIA